VAHFRKIMMCKMGEETMELEEMIEEYRWGHRWAHHPFISERFSMKIVKKANFTLATTSTLNRCIFNANN
jgi:hypothetical protein